jgi:hypothetical protein
MRIADCGQRADTNFTNSHKWESLRNSLVRCEGFGGDAVQELNEDGVELNRKEVKLLRA